jgi:hypothetical protein
VIRSDGSPEGTDATRSGARPPRRARNTDDARLRRATAMRANCWMGRNTVEVREVPDPTLLNRRGRHCQGHLDRDLRFRSASL